METNQERLQRLREKHKRKLEEIKEKKKENLYLIGSKQAYEMIRNDDALLNNPEEASRLINERLEEKLTELTYRANPERINGIFESVRSANEKASNAVNPSQGYNPDEDPVYALDRLHGLKILKYENQILSSDPLVLAKTLYYFFKIANKQGVVLDGEFQDSFISNLSGKCIAGILEIKPNLRRKAMLYAINLAKSLQNQDWNINLSRETYEKWLFKEREYRTTSQNCVHYMVYRALNEMTDHKKEIRKHIVDAWLGLQDVKSYEEAIKRADVLARREQKMFEEAEKSGIEIIISERRKILKKAEYIRLCLGSEKSFIEKYLKS